MERKSPKNVRQIGNVSDTPKIYVEDYVDTFLNQLCDKAEEDAKGAFLVGEKVHQDEEEHVYIYGALEMQELGRKGNDLIISEDAWKKAYEQLKEYFEEGEIIGWFVTGPDFPLTLSHSMKKIQEKRFAGEHSVFILKEPVEREEVYFAQKFHELMQMGGHYIYYEKNPAMQNYMISMRKKIGVTPSEVVEDRAAKDFRSIVREKLEQNEQQKTTKWIYAASTFLMLVVLVIGVTTINNYDKMQSVQDALNVISENVTAKGEETPEPEEREKVREKDEVKEEPQQETKAQEEEAVQETSGAISTQREESRDAQEDLSDDMYVVKKGDTLAGISKKVYGDISHVDAICRMNGLENGNLIYIGQNLLLP